MFRQGTSRRAILTAAVGAGLAPALSWAQDRNTPSPVARSETATTDLLRLLDPAERLTAQVSVNGRGPYAFLVDTGADNSAISMELADALGLARAGRTVLHGVAGSAVVDEVVVASMRSGRRERADMRVPVVPRQNLGADGLLGLDWLSGNNVMLDYSRRRMTIAPHLPLPRGDTFTVPAKTQRNGLTLIDAVIPGVALTAFIDSGSTTTIGNLALLRAAKAHEAILGSALDLRLKSVTGQEMSGTVAILSFLRIGPVQIRAVPVVMGPIHTFDYWGLTDRPALLIGADVLQKFRSVALDFKRGEFRFSMTGLN